MGAFNPLILNLLKDESAQLKGSRPFDGWTFIPLILNLLKDEYLTIKGIRPHSAALPIPR